MIDKLFSYLGYVRREPFATIVLEEKRKLQQELDKCQMKLLALQSKTPLDLTRECLELVTKEETLEALEERVKIDPDLWKGAEYVFANPVFKNVVDLAILTFKDKLALEAEHGKSALLMNRGAIFGARQVHDIIKHLADMAKPVNETQPVQGMDRYKSM